MQLNDFDFHLPEELIALRPVMPRDAARMLAIGRQNMPFQDSHIHALSELLREGDALVFNNTKVIPARLTGHRVGRGETSPKIEVTLHQKKVDHEKQGVIWSAFVKPAKKLQSDDIIDFADGSLQACVLEKGQGGEVVLAFDVENDMFESKLADVGVMPLPPYIASKRVVDEKDYEDYQTQFARTPGAVAAPTAGLHFTNSLLEQLHQKGVSQHYITLHVGAGTFLPVKVENIHEHNMHSEWAVLDASTAEALNAVKRNGGRIIAIGTTSLRVLESFCNTQGMLAPNARETDIFITPGYKFRCVDILLTNFHLPKSTLFMLVSAFCGLDVMKAAYAHAIAQKYRFYSYGDACFLHRCDL
ncbi:MAG: tRNA preQ1(34) S-adenosylmethionine ribosyltransferase-isomerase QueA [Pseudomonadota bacterium]